MFPKLYNKNETNFIHNGLGLLTGAISVAPEEELNGLFELKIEYDNEGFLADVIQEEMIIKTKANDKQDEQLFRIYSITKNHENDNLIIDAQHITYDLGNNFVEKLEARNLTKRQVMQLIGSSTNYEHPFNVTSSNTTTQSSTNLYRTNPLQMIAGMEGSILQIWGGQIERDNFNLIMHDRRGSDDGVLVTYKKNLTGLEATFDISNLVTRIYPFVYKEATDDEPEQLIEVPGKYIDSPHINDYEMPYILPVDFSSEEGIETSQDLLNASSGWFVETGRDKSSVEMSVQFEHLWETEEYKDVAALELVGMGDTVTVKHSKLGVEGTAVVNRIEYDSIARKNIAVDLGNVKANFTDKVNEVGNIVDRVEGAERSANQAIRSANGKNTIHYGPDEPADGNKDDIWFRVVDGEYTRTYRFDGIQWQLVMNKDVADIEETANTAHNRANDAVEKAELATSNANEAISEAQGAFDKAQESLTTAGDAKDIAQSASTLASDASSLASTAIGNAQTAMTDAHSALTDIDDLQTFVNVEIDDINGELSRKVNQTTFNGLAGTVDSHSTSISQNAEAITRKADSELVDTINNTVESNSLLIQETAKGLDLKANQSTVNTLTGQVEAHSLEIQAHANELSSKMTTVDADAKYATQSQLTATSQSLSSDIVAVRGDLDGLEYENRNLISSLADNWTIGSGSVIENISDNHFITSNPRNNTWARSQSQVYNVADGETLTLGVDVIDFVGAVTIQIRNMDENNATMSSGRLTENDKGKRMVRTWTNNLGTNMNIRVWLTVYGDTDGNNGQQFIEAKNIKLEKGNKATPYSKAPEDIDYEFSSINQTVSDITTRVGDSEDNLTTLQQTAESLAGRLSDAEGNLTTLTATSQGLQNRISNAEGDINTVTSLANATQTRITNAEGDINTLTSTANSLTSRIGTIEDWEIGGRNLISGTSDELEKTSFSGWTSNSLYNYYINAESSLQSGDEVIVRVFIKSGDERTALLVNVYNGSTRTSQLSGNYIPANEEGYSTRKFIVPNGTTRLLLQLRHDSSSTPMDIKYFKELMMVKGNKATDWTPAPEDLATQSQITQLSDNINARVQKGDVINQINISTEDILISGKKLILDGDTTVNGTFRVNNANITSVDAGKMTTGTLDAAWVSVINLSANSIVGGILQAQNSNTTFNLNTGNLTMDHNDITFRRGANINFESSGNTLTYRKYDSIDGFSRSSGVGVGDRIGGRYPFVTLGTNGASNLDSLSPYFSGFIANSTAATGEDNAANSVNGYRFQMRSEAVGWNKGLTFDFQGNYPAIEPIRGYDYNYTLGTSSNMFERLHVRGLRTVGRFDIRNNSVTNIGWRLSTVQESGSVTFRGLNGGSYNYNLGSSESHNAFHYGYIKELRPPSSSSGGIGSSSRPYRYGHIGTLTVHNNFWNNSLRTYKENIEDLDLQTAIEFVRGNTIKVFNYKDNPQKSVGLIRDDLVGVAESLIATETAISPINVQYINQKVTQHLLEKNDFLEKRYEQAVLKIAHLEARLNKLEVA